MKTKDFSNMTAEQISSLIASNDHKKIEAVIEGLSSRHLLETAGKSLSLSKILHLFDTVLQLNSKHHWKLSPLLVGLPHAIFSDLLLAASDEQLKILKHEGLTESVQHHITMLSHEFNATFDQLANDSEAFDREITLMGIRDLNQPQLQELIQRIESTSKAFENLYDTTNKALEVAWNTDRTDLIETLNKIKDGCQKYSMFLVGTPRKDTDVPTGLYAKLEDKFTEVYGKLEDPQDIEALHDDEPATEALVKFRVWYLRDYWEIGLLPHIKDIKEGMDNREQLFENARKNLEKIGLKTVKDLKQALITSKKSLKEYIEKHPVI